MASTSPATPTRTLYVSSGAEREPLLALPHTAGLRYGSKAALAMTRL